MVSKAAMVIFRRKKMFFRNWVVDLMKKTYIKSTLGRFYAFAKN